MTETLENRASVVLGVPRERAAAERRVALVPDIVQRLVADGAAVVVERDAGEGSSAPDHLYEEAGAEIVDSPEAVYERADVVLKVQAPDRYDDIDEVGALRSGQHLLAFLSPLTKHALIRELSDKEVEAFSLDAIPRTTRAQAMDALSSQSNLAGYKAVIMAANELGRIFPLMMTAAGTITPARVLILGAGVAGLQAIGTAKRLGAVVYGYDVRAVVKEQVESLGARFVELDLGEDLAGSGGYARQASEEQTRRQQAELAKESALADVVVTTALIPGKAAPVLVAAEAVEGMKPGSVVVDLAGEMGGNCELSRFGETVVEHGVTIMAPTNVPSLVADHASQVLAKNVQNFLGLILQDGRLDVNFDDDIVAGTAIVHDGEIVHELTRKLMGLQELTEAAPVEPAPAPTAPEPPAPAPPVDTGAPGSPPPDTGEVAAAPSDVGMSSETWEPAPETVEDVAGDEPSDIADAIPYEPGTLEPGETAVIEPDNDEITSPEDVFDDIDGEMDRTDDQRDTEARGNA